MYFHVCVACVAADWQLSSAQNSFFISFDEKQTVCFMWNVQKPSELASVLKKNVGGSPEVVTDTDVSKPGVSGGCLCVYLG